MGWEAVVALLVLLVSTDALRTSHLKQRFTSDGLLVAAVKADPPAHPEQMQLSEVTEFEETGAEMGATAGVFLYDGFSSDADGPVSGLLTVTLSLNHTSQHLPREMQKSQWYDILDQHSPLKKKGYHQWTPTYAGFRFKGKKKKQPHVHCVSKGGKRHETEHALVLSFQCGTMDDMRFLEQYRSIQYKAEGHFWSSVDAAEGTPYNVPMNEWENGWKNKLYSATPYGYFGCPGLTPDGSFCKVEPVIYPRLHPHVLSSLGPGPLNQWQPTAFQPDPNYRSGVLAPSLTAKPGDQPPPGFSEHPPPMFGAPVPFSVQSMQGAAMRPGMINDAQAGETGEDGEGLQHPRMVDAGIEDDSEIVQHVIDSNRLVTAGEIPEQEERWTPQHLRMVKAGEKPSPTAEDDDEEPVEGIDYGDGWQPVQQVQVAPKPTNAVVHSGALLQEKLPPAELAREMGLPEGMVYFNGQVMPASDLSVVPQMDVPSQSGDDW